VVVIVVPCVVAVVVVVTGLGDEWWRGGVRVAVLVVLLSRWRVGYVCVVLCGDELELLAELHGNVHV
jgi:hypothetical protein